MTVPIERSEVMNKPVNLDEAYSSFDELWSPRIIAQVNDYDVKVVHVAGEFTWHDHPETDEFFMVTKGRLTIRLGDPDQGLPSGADARGPLCGVAPCRALPSRR